MDCRFCNTPLTHKILDLGSSPLANGYLPANNLPDHEPYYPLQLYRCTTCQLVQLNFEVAPSGIFNEQYSFLSSSAYTWKKHCERYAGELEGRFGKNGLGLIVEIGVNDGTLLELLKPVGRQLLGIDPAESATNMAKEKGLPVVTGFFTNALAKKLAGDGMHADLVVANNVLAHVPNINDFMGGIASMLGENGIATIEFPYLPNVIKDCQFDTVYHEHFFYFSLTAIQKIVTAHHLQVFDIKPLEIHGGSLRVYLKRATNFNMGTMPVVGQMLEMEMKAGIETNGYYMGLQAKAETIRQVFLSWLEKVLAEGKKVMAYGAAAKGNTFLNFAGVTNSQIPFIADVTLQKQGKLLPGSHLPIVAPDQIETFKPDYIVALPWNYKTEINQRLAYTKQWGCKIVYFIPGFEVY